MGQRSFYSIWAMPELDSPLAARVAALIQELSSQYGTPNFEPHVTVLGGFGEPQGLDEEEVAALRQSWPYLSASCPSWRSSAVVAVTWPLLPMLVATF
jgi:hypothetical protein